MKLLRLFALLAVLVALAVPGVAGAEPESPSAFVISPNPAFPGETVTFQFNLDGLDFGNGGPYSLCFYSTLLSAQTYTFPASFASAQGDTWTLQTGSGSCLASGNLRARYTTTDTNGDFGDTLTFNVAVGGAAPAATVSDAWQIRQYDGASETTPRAAASVQWIVAPTIYVANDAAACGSNTPCLTGTGALNRAIDGVSDPAGIGTPGVVTVLGAYNLGGGVTADLAAAKEVTVSGGVGAAVVNSGACVNAMLSAADAGAVLNVEDLTLNGSCVSGQRTAGVLTSAGSTHVRNVNLQNFTGSGHVGIRATGGTVVVEGSAFSGNEAALDGNGGVLYAFANNVTTNLGASAATNVESDDNVRCNYWNSYNVAGGDSAVQFEERLGSPASTYVEGAGALTLGRASLAAGTGSRVIVNLGRSTSAPPFGNGTVTGLGSLTSDFFVVCLARNGSARGDLTVTADNVTPGATGHRLYHIASTVDCSPSTNMACWDYTGQSGASAGASLLDSTPGEGHFVLGNEVDPTAITISSFTANGSVHTTSLWLLLVTAACVPAGIWLWRRRRAIR